MSTRYGQNKFVDDEHGHANAWTMIRGQLARRILLGELPEGAELPSVRNLTSELGAHHSTVSRAYNALAQEGVIEKRNGAVALVAEGGREKLLLSEREAFVAGELPRIISAMKLLDLEWSDLILLATET